MSGRSGSLSVPICPSFCKRRLPARRAGRVESLTTDGGAMRRVRHSVRMILSTVLTVVAGLAMVSAYFAASVFIGRWAGIAVILVVPVVMWVLLERSDWVRTRRQERGRCAGCGYDLTGNVSGLCPECGDRIATLR